MDDIKTIFSKIASTSTSNLNFKCSDQLNNVILKGLQTIAVLFNNLFFHRSQMGCSILNPIHFYGELGKWKAIYALAENGLTNSIKTHI